MRHDGRGAVAGAQVARRERQTYMSAPAEWRCEGGQCAARLLLPPGARRTVGGTWQRARRCACKASTESSRHMHMHMLPAPLAGAGMRTRRERLSSQGHSPARALAT